MRGAGDVNWSLSGYALDYVLGAGKNARAAVYALVGVNFCKSSFNRYRVFGAYVFAVAAAEAGIFAHLVAVEKSVACRTGLIAVISKRIDRVCVAAVALYNGNFGLFGFEFHAEQFCNFSLLFGRCYVAGGKVAAAVGKLCGKSRTAAATAAAAVGAGKVFKYFGHLFVHVHLKYFADDEYSNNNDKGKPQKNSGDNADGFPCVGGYRAEGSQ